MAMPSEWNDALLAAKAKLLDQAALLDTLKRPDNASNASVVPVHFDCLHPELTFDNGDYLVICHTCNSRWVMVSLGRESDIDRSGQTVGGDVSLACKGAAAQLSGQRRVKP